MGISPWWSRSLAHRLLRRLLTPSRYFRAVCLGGGTLILGGSCSPFGEALDLGLPGWTFGTGVKNPSFWRSIPGWNPRLREWREVLGRCIRVTVRGPHSQKILKDYGIESTVVGDPVFLESSTKLPALPSRPVLGLNFGWSGNRLWGGDDQRVANTMICAARALKNDGWGMELYCVSRSEDRTTLEASDRLDVDRGSIKRIFSDAGKFMSSVRECCTVFVGFKLHASLLAFCSYVPTIALEYRPKVRDFMASVDCESRCLRTDTLDADELTAQIVRAHECRKDIQEKQADRSLALRDKLLDQIRWLKRF